MSHKQDYWRQTKARPIVVNGYTFLCFWAGIQRTLWYCAEFHEELFGWLAIHPNGTTGVSHRDTVFFPNNYFVPTEAEAGARINRHATGRGQRVVWSA